jgi:arylsulfatase A-like enzyme
VNFLHDKAASDDTRPFFLQCSFPDPHHPFTPPGHYADLYDPDDVTLPASWDQPLDQCPPHVRYVRELFDSGERDIDVGFAYAVSEREAREAIALTYGMIALIDDMVGRILSALKETGLEKNTVVVFISDHGDYMGDHRLLLKGPVHYRGVTNVPFIWCDPEASSPGRVFDGLASSIDVAPTLLARAGLQPFHGVQGRNLLPQIMRDDTPCHEAIMIEEENQRLLFGFDAPPRVQTLLTDDLRLSIYDGIEWGELYDLTRDPDEMKNLWDDPKRRDMKLSALERMTRFSLKLKDRSPHPTMRA